MRFELGTSVCLGVSCTTTELRRVDFLTLVAGHSIANVIAGVLCMVVYWCVHDAVWTIVGAMGFVVVVTGGVDPTL